MIGWKAVVDAGTQWVMTNNAEGRTPGLQGYTDKETYKLLREDLGYKGIICLDWPLSASSVMNLTGVTTDGIDISTLSLGERYTLILDVGIDMFSCYSMTPGVEINDVDEAVTNCYHPDAIIAEIEAGKIAFSGISNTCGLIQDLEYGDLELLCPVWSPSAVCAEWRVAVCI